MNDKEKIILSLILFFSKEKPCCYIKNEQLSEKEKIQTFVRWVYQKLSAPSEEEVIQDFERETYVNFDIERQIRVNTELDRKNDEMER